MVERLMGRKGGNWRLDGLGHDPGNPHADFRHRVGKSLTIPWALASRGYDPDEKAAALAKSLRNALDKRGRRRVHSLRKRTSYFFIILLAAGSM